MKVLLFLCLLLPGFMVAQISGRTIEIQQRQKFYKTGDWSSWLRHEGLGYRYHWGLNPVEEAYKDMMDLNFEIRNEGNIVGYWKIEIMQCNSDVVLPQNSRLTILAPNELKTITFFAPNCGTLDTPRLRYKIQRMTKID